MIGLDELIKLEEEEKKPKEVEPPVLVEEDVNEGIEDEEVIPEKGRLLLCIFSSLYLYYSAFMLALGHLSGTAK